MGIDQHVQHSRDRFKQWKLALVKRAKQRAHMSEIRMDQMMQTLESEARDRIAKAMLPAIKAKADYEAKRAAQFDDEVAEAAKIKPKTSLDTNDRSKIVKEVIAKSQEKALQDHLAGKGNGA